MLVLYNGAQILQGDPCHLCLLPSQLSWLTSAPSRPSHCPAKPHELGPEIWG